MLDPTWARLGNRRSGQVRRGALTGDLLAWDAGLAVSFNISKPRGLSGHDVALLAEPPPAPAPPPGAPKQQAPETPATWRVAMPEGTQVEALALGADGLAAALRIADGAQARGVLLVLGRDGGERARIDLPAPPCVHGLALADGVILVALEDGSLTAWGG
jgi:hypothetical protein